MMRTLHLAGSLCLLVPVLMTASAVVTPPLRAQDPPIAVTWPGQFDDGTDVEVPVDPLNPDFIPTLGDPLLASSEADSALFVASTTDPDLIYPLGLTAPPRLGAQTSTNAHYLSYTYKGGPVVLVGVSADNACHFVGPGAAQCGYGTGGSYGASYKPFIDDLFAQGLNSLRLWVSIVGGGTTSRPTPTTCPGAAPFTTTVPNTTPARVTNDNPFKYAGGTLVNGVGRWYLDTSDTDYFQRLAAVVNYANSKNIIVEVTLFSPLTGNIGIGPYGLNHAYLSNGTKLTDAFTDTANFTNIHASQYIAMRPYLQKVIEWTVDALYSYPNVYFEVANEPENIQSSNPNSGGCGNMTATSGRTVAEWQQDIAQMITTYENDHYVTPHGSLAHAHLVAVEPSTVTGATNLASGGDFETGQIINSHYTVFNAQGAQVRDGLGAITMIQQYASQSKIFGFNETKITGGLCASANTRGSVEAGRAEAWEFLLGQGGIYNQYGYDCYGVHTCTPGQNATGNPASNDYCRTRAQMGALRRFVSDSLVSVVYGTKTSAPIANGTRWINVGTYPGPAVKSVAKFWAALEPQSSVANKRWLLYIHHSQRRSLVQDGYAAAIIPTGGTPYKESNLSVCLVGAPQGIYTVRWYTHPDTAVASAPNNTTTINWTAPANCTPGGAGAVQLVSAAPHDSDPYAYDLAILISK